MKPAFFPFEGCFHNQEFPGESRMRNISFDLVCIALFPINYRFSYNITKLIKIIVKKLFLPAGDFSREDIEIIPLVTNDKFFIKQNKVRELIWNVKQRFC